MTTLYTKIKKCQWVYSIVMSALAFSPAYGQADILPAPKHEGVIVLKNATVHTGTGKVLENTDIIINKHVIEFVGKNALTALKLDKVKTVNCVGKHIYPGLISSKSTLGLMEINAVRPTHDSKEVGEWNTSIQSFYAYNTDSKVINTVRDNGILLVNVCPEGSIIAGKSSVMQLDAWNWEDALYAKNVGLHIYLPTLVNTAKLTQGEKKKKKKKETYEEKTKALKNIYDFLSQAKAYCASPSPKKENIKLENMRNIFNKKELVFIHANWVKEIIAAMDIAKTYDIKVVIVGGYDSWKLASTLKEKNIPIILHGTHKLPLLAGDPIDINFKTPYLLQKAGVLFAISSDNNYDRGRNLSYHAGTAVAYGLTKEQALASITSNPAKILGIHQRTGSIEIGKDANLLVVEGGDLLDMFSSHITHAFIQGRQIDLNNSHKKLHERYKKKYEIVD